MNVSVTEHNNASELGESLPFPFNQQTFCRYEPIEQRIDDARVLVVDNLLRDERDISPVAVSEWGPTLAAQLKRERHIAGMAPGRGVVIEGVGRRDGTRTVVLNPAYTLFAS